ncbi:MAG: exodeoxyribonuclease V subunit alpha [Rhodanobacteraceae bacterium]|nr:MAG: exodeoxyribonuclease V subunit alpha [Rhodanobacteraceae bacterium]
MSDRLASLVQSGHLRRVDVALGDWVVRAFPGTPPEVALAAALAARAVADGHSALALDRAQAWLEGLDGEGKPEPLPAPAAWCGVLRAAAAVQAYPNALAGAVAPLVLDPQRRVYLRRYFEYERQLAGALVQRARATPGATPAPTATDGLDAAQQQAIDTALSGRFTLITGGPGSGKTYSVVRLLAALVAQAHAAPLRIALSAPTGKAAARLCETVRAQLGRLHLPVSAAEQIPTTASTVHRLLGLNPATARARFDAAAPLPFDVIVVDEVSMVDLPLMTRLVAAVPDSARLILLGDPDQLSAVEAGDVLGALVAAAHAGPLRACHVALTRGHRFGADSALGALARAIATGNADAALAICTHGPGISLVEPAQRTAFITAAAAAYTPVLDAADAAQALRAARAFRVLTALRRGPSGCVALDRAIAAHLQRASGIAADARWWRGRLLLVTANRPELGLFNGDTGVVWPDADGILKAWFAGADGTPRPLAPAALPPHEGAFALTVHKAQGSEFDRVALVTGPDSAVLTRQLLYTGVTRARERVQLYADPAVLHAGIERNATRFGGLADRIGEAARTATVTSAE